MKNKLLDEIASASIILMIYYIGGFIFGAFLVYLLHWIGLV